MDWEVKMNTSIRIFLTVWMTALYLGVFQWLVYLKWNEGAGMWLSFMAFALLGICIAIWAED